MIKILDSDIMGETATRQYKTKEYIFILEKDVFRVYAETQELAEETFKNLCLEYKNTPRKDHGKYWDDILKKVENDKLEVIQNYDFKGVRRIK